MRAALLGLLLAGAAAVVGCGESAMSDASDAAPPFVPASPWKATSTHLEMKSFGFFSGASGYSKNRADMTPPQLSALDGLRTTTPRSIAADADTFTITIFDADGSKATYSTAYAGGAEAAYTPVDFETWKPFLTTLQCSSSQNARPCSVPADAAPPVDCHLKLVDDTGCLNGITAMSVCADIWMTIAVSSPGTYDIAALGCFDTTTIEARSADGATVLGTSAAATAPSCPVLHQTFTTAGDYRVVVKKRATKDCASGALQEFFVQIAHAK